MNLANRKSEGRRALVAVVQASSGVAVAKTLGVTSASVSRWLSGHHRPFPRARRLLLQHYRIDPRAWDRRIYELPSR